MAKLATPRRDSDGRNFRGFRFRGSVVVSYTTVSIPWSDGIEGTKGIIQLQSQYKSNLAVLAAWHWEKTLGLHQDNGVRQDRITGVILCVIYTQLARQKLGK
jgi:hypothetical protein